MLGKGSFARAYLLTNRFNGEKFAVKSIRREIFSSNKKKNQMKNVQREIKLHQRLSKLDHKNIIKFYSYFETPSFVFLVLELAELRTLKDVTTKRGTVTEPEATYYFTQIAAGLKFLGDNKIIHRDLKLGNLFLSADMTEILLSTPGVFRGSTS